MGYDAKKSQLLTYSLLNPTPPLPHDLHAYRDQYNKSGVTVGCYTAPERMELLERFKGKRERRCWRKKVKKRAP